MIARAGMQTTRVFLPVVVVLAAAVGGAASAADGTTMVIRAGKIIPVVGEPIADGAILVRDGKVAAVGPDIDVPAGATVLDARDGVVIPGLVTALTNLAESGRDTRESITPELRTADGLDLYGDWRLPLSGGVTTVYLSPPSRRLVPGRGSVAKLAAGSPSARVLSDSAALRIVLGEWPKRPPDLWDPPMPPTAETPSAPPEKQLPTTRMGEMAALRQVFNQARTETGDDGPRREALRAALNGETPVRVHADRVEDIRNALALGEEFGLRIVIEGGAEAYLLADELGRRKIPVVLTPPMRPGKAVAADLSQTQERGRVRADSAATLMKAGVAVAIATPDDSLPELLAIAACLVGYGAPEDAALRAVTAGAAEVLGVSDRAGSIQIGRDADLAILTGDPFATRTVVQTTISDGRIVYGRKTPKGPGAPTGSPLRVIRAREVFTGSGGVVHDGEIRVRGGRIESVGRRDAVPPEAEVIDLGGSVIMPGMIDMQSHLGLHWESEQATLGPQPATTGPASGAAKLVPIAHAVDPTDAALRDALCAGVTAIALAPADAGLFCGTVSVLKTAAGDVDEMIVKPVAALKFSMLASRDKLATIWQVRDLLEKAKKYDSDWTEFDRRWAEFERRWASDADPDLTEPQPPKRDGELETMRALFVDGVPALVVADRPDEVTNAIEVFRGEYGLDLAILGAGEADRVADDLSTARVVAAVGPEVIREERGREINTAAELSGAGVHVAFQSRGTSGTQFLRTTAAYAARRGMEPLEALRGITVRPAEILGLDHRIGCIEPGRDADLVVLSGDPLELTSRVEKVFVNGDIVYDTGAQE